MNRLGRIARWLLGFTLFAVLTAAGLWSARDAIFAYAGRMLVTEDPLQPADVIIVSEPTMPGGLLEAAHLYRDGIAPTVMFPSIKEPPYQEELRQLGMHKLPPTRYATWFLEQSGVPRDAVRALPQIADGTETAIAAVVQYAREHEGQRIIFIVDRTHTTRSRWLLERALPAGTTLVVRSPGSDEFDPSSWWRSRQSSREVAMEYLRWVNSFVLGDPWSSQAVPLEQAGETSPRGKT